MSGALAIENDTQVSASDWLAPDCHGLNFFDIDQSLQGLLKLYLPDDLRQHMTPHFQRLGEIAGERLDELGLDFTIVYPTLGFFLFDEHGAVHRRAGLDRSGLHDAGRDAAVAAHCVVAAGPEQRPPARVGSTLR